MTAALVLLWLRGCPHCTALQGPGGSLAHAARRAQVDYHELEASEVDGVLGRLARHIRATYFPRIVLLTGDGRGLEYKGPRDKAAVARWCRRVA